jgi:hypothetical protein
MAKVVAIHEIELHPGVKEEDYERFFTEEFAPAYSAVPGWKITLLKGDRGARAGKYVVTVEIESVETRDRHYPAPDQPSEELQRYTHDLTPLFEKAGTYAVVSSTTDYVAVGT